MVGNLHKVCNLDKVGNLDMVRNLDKTSVSGFNEDRFGKPVEKTGYIEGPTPVFVVAVILHSSNHGSVFRFSAQVWG